MIAFASAITKPDVYDECAGPGIELAAEPDSVIIANSASGSIFRSYNLILDQAAQLEDLEALVLLHQDAEIVDPQFCAKLRRALAEPDVGVVGCVGAVGVRSIAWWEGSVTWASFTHRYSELGGGDLPAFGFDGEPRPAYARTGEVDTVDGFVLACSPWTVRNVRFDESLGQALHGYDFDFCLQVREGGHKVLTEDFQVVHHHSLDLVSDPDTWIEAHMRVAEKWDGRMPHVGEEGGDWKARARRAEAEAAVLRVTLVANEMKAQAREGQLQRDFDITVDSISWKVTLPLRKANLWRREMSERRRGEAESG
jgi:hypothetical protein